MLGSFSIRDNHNFGGGARYTSPCGNAGWQSGGLACRTDKSVSGDSHQCHCFHDILSDAHLVRSDFQSYTVHAMRNLLSKVLSSDRYTTFGWRGESAVIIVYSRVIELNSNR